MNTTSHLPSLLLEKKTNFSVHLFKIKANFRNTSGYAPTQVTSLLSQVLKPQKIIRAGHNLLYFCLLQLLLTILKHLLTQHIPLLRYPRCILPLGCQGIQHLDSGFQFATKYSKMEIFTSVAHFCYILHSPENKTNIHVFSSQGLEASSHLDFHLPSFSPVPCSLQFPSSSSLSSQYLIRWASSRCSSL